MIIIPDLLAMRAHVNQRFASLSGASEAEPPSQLSKLLYTNEFALDIVSLHVRVSEIAAHALRYLSEYDCEAVGQYIFTIGVPITLSLTSFLSKVTRKPP